MSLAPGVRFGVYEVCELIGAGGMGEVYRARDTRLNRDVALKTLPHLFSLDPDRLVRFKREAQVLASLNHSNIASIFGFEESEGVQALVLELIEGPTLADRIAQGPLPLDEALLHARQIADALEAAHAQGIVHRDLKPANIKIRTDGTVKVLDFGLARALAADASSPVAAQLPTITSPAATQLGTILGTAAYMSPEQARGKVADKRSDIWAFGGVLYEMLTGKRAFDGDDVSDTVANVLKREPDWGALPATIPSAVRRVLRRCLEKDPRHRFHDIADARLDLDEKEVPDAAAPAPVASRFLNPERVVWTLLAAALAVGLAYSLLRERPAAQVLRFQIDAPQKGFFGSSSGIGRADGTSGGTFSPDGTQLVFVATDQSGRTLLWLHRLDSFMARPLAGTDDALLPIWSPDGRFIAFFAGSKLRKLDPVNGSIQTICDVPGVPRGGTWGSRDVIVVSSGQPARLTQVSAHGGTVAPVQMESAASQARAAVWPSFLPDGVHFLYWTRISTDGLPALSVASIEPGFAPKRLVASDSNGAFAPPGLLVFMRGDTLMQQHFDPDSLELTGDATPIAENVLRNTGIGRADFSLSATGALMFRSTSNMANQFAWFDRAGKMLETVGPRGSYRTPDLSPDGKRLAYTDITQGDIWIFDLVRQTSSRFTASPGSETAPAWFPDGTKIAYRSDQGGLFEKDVSGTGTERRLLNENISGPSQVSPDSKWLLYFATPLGQSMDIFVLPTVGPRTPMAIVHTQFPEMEPQFSPDGRWLAYASSETGRNEIYVQPFPTTGSRWPVSNKGGRQPLWRADGKELFFVADDRRFYAVDISQKTGSFDYGVPHFLFEMRANVFNTRNSYIPSPDGQRFLVNTILEEDDAPIKVVHNWQAALKK
jgi:eukaryotic-like serine/threonine-protein kinase